MNYQAKLKELQDQLEALQPNADWNNAIAFNMAQTDNTGDY